MIDLIDIQRHNLNNISHIGNMAWECSREGDLFTENFLRIVHSTLLGPDSRVLDVTRIKDQYTKTQLDILSNYECIAPFKFSNKIAALCMEANHEYIDKKSSTILRSVYWAATQRKRVSDRIYPRRYNSLRVGECKTEFTKFVLSDDHGPAYINPLTAYPAVMKDDSFKIEDNDNIDDLLVVFRNAIAAWKEAKNSRDFAFGHGSRGWEWAGIFGRLLNGFYGDVDKCLANMEKAVDVLRKQIYFQQPADDGTGFNTELVKELTQLYRDYVDIQPLINNSITVLRKNRGPIAHSHFVKGAFDAHLSNCYCERSRNYFINELIPRKTKELIVKRLNCKGPFPF